MHRKLVALPLLALLWSSGSYAAVDSYRYLHVTIETPWVIFLVLLPMVLTPLVLMAVLAWRYAERKREHEAQQAASESDGK
jgi:heme/copper-type cytochrome/quinol oxidase subunit 2